jgi:hypothetical protein
MGPEVANDKPDKHLPYKEVDKGDSGPFPWVHVVLARTGVCARSNFGRFHRRADFSVHPSLPVLILYGRGLYAVQVAHVCAA